MLQKEFFQVQSFNPNPYWNPVIVNLSGAQKFEEDTVFEPGIYEVLVRAGSSFGGNSVGTEPKNFSFGKSGKILQTITIPNNFIVRAYCGSSSTRTTAGINLYSGEYKVNPYYGTISTVNHIFGNCGSSAVYLGSNPCLGSGNCLGNGVINEYGYTIGAGSCLHIMPIGGVFGTDYYYAFHTTASTICSLVGPGSGSSYGGSGSGGCYAGSQSAITTYKGGDTPFGIGGAAALPTGGQGNDGTGIGHGYGAKGNVSTFNGEAEGSAAWFNGTSWVESLERTNVSGEQGCIYIKYLGALV